MKAFTSDDDDDDDDDAYEDPADNYDDDALCMHVYYIYTYIITFLPT